MAHITFFLPDDLLEALSHKADALSIPKEKLVENAVRLYLENFERAEYTLAFNKASSDKDNMSVAELGMADYLEQIIKT